MDISLIVALLVLCFVVAAEAVALAFALYRVILILCGLAQQYQDRMSFAMEVIVRHQDEVRSYVPKAGADATAVGRTEPLEALPAGQAPTGRTNPARAAAEAAQKVIEKMAKEPI